VPVTVHSSTVFTYPNAGPDSPTTHDTKGKMFTAAHPKMFRSADYGDTWTQVLECNVFSYLTYIREITHIGDGVVLAYAAGNENEINDRALRYYKSTDYGVTWTVLPNQFSSEYGPLNSVYEVVIVDDREHDYYSILAGTQPDSAILFSRI
ncbi:hypothetical protein KIPB_010365, partial [Kipferlia bialata]